LFPLSEIFEFFPVSFYYYYWKVYTNCFAVYLTGSRVSSGGATGRLEGSISLTRLNKDHFANRLKPMTKSWEYGER